MLVIAIAYCLCMYTSQLCFVYGLRFYCVQFSVLYVLRNSEKVIFYRNILILLVY